MELFCQLHGSPRPEHPAVHGLYRAGFYNCDYVQSLVANKGASNPFMFVVLLVGVQGVAEFLVSGILGGISGPCRA